MKPKPIPPLKTDKDAEDFIDTADLTQYDLSPFQETHFELQDKTARITLRLPKNQLDALKNEAKQRHIPYQRLIRYYIERGLGTPLS